MSLGLFIALAVLAPRAGELKTFGDWIAGCDNARACQARALIPAGDGTGFSVMELRRGAFPTAPVAIAIVDVEPRGSVEVVAGEHTFAASVDNSARIDAPDAFVPAILAAARAEPALLLRTRNNVAARISLKGASAALLWIDEQQKRVGTTTALSHPGVRSSSTVPEPPPLPRVVVPARGSSKPPDRATASALKEAVGDSGCKAGDHRSDQPSSYDRLDARHTLVLVPLICVSGDYNYEVDAYIIADGSTGDLQPASYEKVFADREDGGDITNENTSWDPRRRRLSVGMKGRSFGDCGSRREYAWDGRRFRFVFEEDMGECRGATDYIPTWRAVVLER